MWGVSNHRGWMTHRVRCRRNLRRLPHEPGTPRTRGCRKTSACKAGGCRRTCNSLKCVTGPNLWELLEVATVANAVGQSHRRRLTHRVRCRRNLRRLPREPGTPRTRGCRKTSACRKACDCRRTCNCLKCVTGPNLWELLEVTTVANAVGQSHRRRLTHRVRCRRNLRRLLQGPRRSIAIHVDP